MIVFHVARKEAKLISLRKRKWKKKRAEKMKQKPHLTGGNKDKAGETTTATTSKENAEPTDNNKHDEKIKHNLSTADRKLLAFFFGYLRGVQRDATKKREDACLFVNKSLFDGEEDDGKIYDVEKEIDFSNLQNTPGLFTRTKQEVFHFLCYGGLNSTDVEESVMVRSFQIFTRVRPQQVQIGNNSKYLCLLALGTVSSLT